MGLLIGRVKYLYESCKCQNAVREQVQNMFEFVSYVTKSSVIDGESIYKRVISCIPTEMFSSTKIVQVLDIDQKIHFSSAISCIGSITGYAPVSLNKQDADD